MNWSLARQTMEQELRTTLLDHAPRGIALLDERGEVVHLNRNALAILKACDGLMLDGKSIRAVLPEENFRFKRLLKEALLSSHGKGPANPKGCMLVTRTVAEIPLSILFVPFRSNLPFPHESRVRVILFLSNLDRCSTNAEEVLRALHGFTEAESRMAGLLLRGLSIEESARRLEITLNTARTHLKKLFLKTDTKRQCDLIHVLLEGSATLHLD